MIGKQDPYIKFKYDNKYGQTEVKDAAGKHAVWNEKFCLSNIEAQAIAGKKLVFESYDKDILSSDWLGNT
jgi:Ca2+-dependent lipid-binding protein